MMSKTIKIGLFGFGCVGQGLYDVLNQSSGFRAGIVTICVKDRSKKRTLASSFFTFEKHDILGNPEINLVVELIDDAEEAYRIVKAALESGKNVVTANKKMLANHLEELVALQHRHGVSLLYEASSCGSIPILRNLEEYYDNEQLNSVSGIFNGTSNYILSKIFNENLDYSTALKQAQEKGFAETDPTSDVGGYDTKYKLVIITAHSFGLHVKPEDVLNIGIQNLSQHDIQFAREKGYKIKLVATVKKTSGNEIVLLVIPQFVNNTNYLYNVENEYNGVIVEAFFSDKQFFLGKGAGGHPTGSAVLSDISTLKYDYKYEYKKQQQGLTFNYTKEVELEVYFRYKNEIALEELGFTKIEERFIGREFSYVIGTVTLSNIIKNKQVFDSPHNSIISTGLINNIATLSQKGTARAIAAV
jgi:homoserine dehydrogenase